MRRRLRCLIIPERPVDHVGQAADPRILCALDNIHQPKPILAYGQIGKPPDRTGRVFPHTLVIASRRLANPSE